MMSSEDENYVTVTVKARGARCRFPAARPWWSRSVPATHSGPRSTSATSVWGRSRFSPRLPSPSWYRSASGLASPRTARIELVYAATRCGYSEEEERDALYCSLDNDVDEEPGKEGEDE